MWEHRLDCVDASVQPPFQMKQTSMSDTDGHEENRIQTCPRTTGTDEHRRLWFRLQLRSSQILEGIIYHGSHDWLQFASGVPTPDRLQTLRTLARLCPKRSFIDAHFGVALFSS